MVMLQTTNSIFNMSLYELVKPQSLLAWQRVRVANMMSHSGREWAMNVAEENSGKITVMSHCFQNVVCDHECFSVVCISQLRGTGTSLYSMPQD